MGNHTFRQKYENSPKYNFENSGPATNLTSSQISKTIIDFGDKPFCNF